jgi:hypothetical protein
MLFGIRPIDKCIHVDHWHDPTEQLVNNQYNIGSKCGDLILIRLILLNFIQCLIKVVVIVFNDMNVNDFIVDPMWQ